MRERENNLTWAKNELHINVLSISMKSYLTSHACGLGESTQTDPVTYFFKLTSKKDDKHKF